jgi:hypothetical protein
MALTNSDKKFCLSNGVNVEKIKLHRHGKKRWSFDGVNEKSVEYAALDYFRAQGWDGYFTEYENYWDCLILIMGYPNWRKRRPATIVNISNLFLHTKDGINSDFARSRDPDFFRPFKPLPEGFAVCQPNRDTHDLTFDQVWESVYNFHSDDLLKTLSYFKEINFKRLGFGTVASGQKGVPSARTIDGKKLEGFYHSQGKEYIIEKLQHYYSRENFDIFLKCYRLSMYIDNMGKRNGILVDEFFSEPSPHFLMDPHYCCAIHRKENAELGISMLQKYANEFLKIGQIDMGEYILECCEDILFYRKKTGMDQEVWPTSLDLYMWRGQELAAVEVKAPNDRLRVGQKETLLVNDRVKRWVVEVEDLNGDSASVPTTRRKSITRRGSGSDNTVLKSDRAHNARKAQDLAELAELADTLRVEGLWSDLMKEIVYLATQGKKVSLTEKQLAQEELAARQDLSELLFRHLS